MRIGIVGCGFTADHYFPCLKQYPELEVVAGADRNAERASKYCQYHSIQTAPNLDALLAEPSIELILNLTSTSSHFEVTSQCLEAGKHVYSEKTLAPDFSEAQALAELATAKGLYLSSAPANLLGETAQTLWRALRKNEIGKIRAVYAEMDDGPIQLNKPNTWGSESGAPFDYVEEFEVGVTIEHSCYYLTLLAAYFGPAKTITAFSRSLWPEKQVLPNEPATISTPDLTVACLTFESGVVARLTCSLVAPYNHVMKIVGDTGTLSVLESLNFSAPVYLERYSQFRLKADRYPITRRFPFIANLYNPGSGVYPSVKKASLINRFSRYRPDYGRGVAEMVRAIQEGRRPRLPLDFCLHIAELSWAIQNPTDATYQVKTTFEPLEPMDDAALKSLIPARW